MTPCAAVRHLPNEPLPAYTYVPGRAPHPLTDPRGHSYGRTPSPCGPLDPARWRECRDYLRGLDLFNAGYYWEAHEAWEGVWLAVGRVGPVADFLKGLIKLAAAGVKAYEGRPVGVRRHALRARELLQSAVSAQADERMAGLDVRELQEHAGRVAAHPPTCDQEPPQAAAVGLGLTLHAE